MSSNLPPGVTNQMIEDFAARESLLEAFERHLNKQEGGKTQREDDDLDIIYNRLFNLPTKLEKVGDVDAYTLQAFVERAMQWAYEQGRNDESYSQLHEYKSR